ncbi:MAG: nuclease-related domain-containing protein [Woeseiaceae bacterium]|nr:nuclease-related domain-containing protein [Woeseiaceae bacterium]
MMLLLRTLLTSLPLIAMPAVAAIDDVETGITSVGPAMFIFTLAAAILLTLVFRSTAAHVANFLTSRIGRFRIRRALQARSKDVLHDVILPGAYGGLAKIDHAIMTAGGILCIRTVHFNGIVFGGEDEAQWTNVDGVSRRRFLNPLIQNEGRTRALQNVVPEVPVANLVVFTGTVEFTSDMPKNVIRVDNLESFIAKFVFGPSKVDDWDAVWLTVQSAVLSDDAAKKDFAAQISFS